MAAIMTQDWLKYLSAESQQRLIQQYVDTETNTQQQGQTNNIRNNTYNTVNNYNTLSSNIQYPHQQQQPTQQLYVKQQYHYATTTLPPDNQQQQYINISNQHKQYKPQQQQTTIKQHANQPVTTILPTIPITQHAKSNKQKHLSKHNKPSTHSTRNVPHLQPLLHQPINQTTNSQNVSTQQYPVHPPAVITAATASTQQQAQKPIVEEPVDTHTDQQQQSNKQPTIEPSLLAEEYRNNDTNLLEQLSTVNESMLLYDTIDNNTYNIINKNNYDTRIYKELYEKNKQYNELINKIDLTKQYKVQFDEYIYSKENEYQLQHSIYLNKLTSEEEEKYRSNKATNVTLYDHPYLIHQANDAQQTVKALDKILEQIKLQEGIDNIQLDGLTKAIYEDVKDTATHRELERCNRQIDDLQYDDTISAIREQYQPIKECVEQYKVKVAELNNVVQDKQENYSQLQHILQYRRQQTNNNINTYKDVTGTNIHTKRQYCETIKQQHYNHVTNSITKYKGYLKRLKQWENRLVAIAEQQDSSLYQQQMKLLGNQIDQLTINKNVLCNKYYRQGSDNTSSTTAKQRKAKIITRPRQTRKDSKRKLVDSSDDERQLRETLEEFDAKFVVNKPSKVIGKPKPNATVNDNYYSDDEQLDDDIQNSSDACHTSKYIKIDHSTSTSTSTSNKQNIIPGRKRLQKQSSVRDKSEVDNSDIDLSTTSKLDIPDNDISNE